MKKNKLIVLGCSITHHFGWADYLSSIIDTPLLNLAESSGSNALQQYRFQENLFNNRITSDDIIIWQITGSTRRYKRMEDNVNSRDILIKDNSLETQSSIITSKNIFDNLTFLKDLNAKIAMGSSVQPSIIFLHFIFNK